MTLNHENNIINGFSKQNYAKKGITLAPTFFVIYFLHIFVIYFTLALDFSRPMAAILEFSFIFRGQILIILSFTICPTEYKTVEKPFGINFWGHVINQHVFIVV